MKASLPGHPGKKSGDQDTTTTCENGDCHLIKCIGVLLAHLALCGVPSVFASSGRLTLFLPVVTLVPAGEASEWRDTAAAATPTRSNSDRAFRVAGTVAIVAALAVTTLVFLSGDNDSATTLAGKVVGAVAQNEPAPHAPKVVMAGPKVALSAPPKVALSSSPKASVAGKGTTKMSDNWKINENVPDSPSYADLKREVNELEAEEKHHFEARANSMSKAMDSADKEGNGAALKGLKWKNAKDKYEQAAFKDIMDEEKEHVTETITQQGAQMFQSYEKQAQSLLGTDDLEKLQNSSAIAEKERSMREKSALFALKSASAALKKVESAEDAQREEEDKKKQERADAKEEAHLKNAASLESGSKQYYRKVIVKIVASGMKHFVVLLNCRLRTDYCQNVVGNEA